MAEITRISSFEQSISKWRIQIMGLSMIAIMLFHQWFFKSNSIPLNVFHNFGHWGVDVFLFLSGMGLTRSLQKNPFPTYYKRRFSRIVPSCFIFGITKYTIFLLLGTPVIIQKALNIGLISIASLDLWFINTIIILYTLSPFLYKFLRKAPAPTIICIIFIYLFSQYMNSLFAIDGITPLRILSWTIGRLPVFALGMYLSIKKEWNNNYMYISIFCLLLAIIIIIANKINYKFHSLLLFHSLILAIGTPSMIMLSIILLRSFPQFLLKPISFIGDYSLELYLIHEFVFCVMNVELSHVNHLILFVSAFYISCFTAYALRLVKNKITDLI